MDRLEAMAVFVAVAEEGGFSAASRRLRMPLASVSRKVADLEAHVKVRLFNRSTRRVVPTEAGERFHRECRRILEELEDAERGAAGEYTAPRGDLTLTAPIVFGRLHLVPVIGEFLGVFPEVDIRLLLADRTLNLFDERIDLALRIGNLPDSAMVATRVGETRRVVCAGPAYLETRGRPRHPRELIGHDCIDFSGLDMPRQWLFREDGAPRGYPIAPRLTVTTAEAAIAAAVQGSGITRVLSYQVAESVARGALSVVLKRFEPETMPVNLLHPSGRPMPQKLRAFLDFTAPRLRSRLKTRGLAEA